MADTKTSLRSFGQNNEAALWLLLIVIAAALLRLYGLSFQSYWYDELFSAYISNPAHSLEEVISLTLADVHPPFYQLAMWSSYRWLGYTEWAGRLPSVLAGIATVPVVFLLGKELFGGRTGLYAAALAMPNFYLVYYAQEARSYSFFCFLSALSFYFFLRALRNGSWLSVLPYVLASTLLLYTHYFGFIVLIIQSLLLAVYLPATWNIDKKLIIRAAVAAMLIILAVLPLVPSMLAHANIREFWIQQPQAIVAINYFIGYFDSMNLALIFGALILVAATLGLFRIPARADRVWVRFGVASLLFWIALGFLIPWTRGLISQPVITDRNTIMLLPPIIVLAAYGLASIPGLLVQRVAGAALLGYATYHLIFVADYYTQAKKNQFREIAAAMTAYGETLPVYTFNYNDTKYNVYFEQQNSPLIAVDASVLEDELTKGTAPALFWLADAHFGMFTSDLPERFKLVRVARYRMPGVGADLYVNPDRATPVALEPALISAADGNWLSTSVISWSGEHDQLLVGLNAEAQQDPLRDVQVDLLDARGNNLESHAAKLGAMPATLQFDPELPAGSQIRLVIRMPINEPEPAVWMLRQE
ncbi:MAG: glycosyltransferase family 39 protein [Gammaproteobacteria bacterium]|jgi:mannosyltransferase